VTEDSIRNNVEVPPPKFKTTHSASASAESNIPQLNVDALPDLDSLDIGSFVEP
jgi:hypothetical protein